MQRQKVGRLVKLPDRSGALHAVGLEQCVVRHERIVGDDVHPHRLALAADELADVAVGMDAQRLALNLRSRAGRKTVARHEDHHRKGQFGHRIGVLPGGVHHHDPAGRSGFQVDVVVTGAGTHHDFEILRGGDHFGRHLVAANDQGVDIGHGGEQLRPIGVFFQQGQFVPRLFHNAANALHRLFSERLLGCNQYFHIFE